MRHKMKNAIGWTMVATIFFIAVFIALLSSTCAVNKHGFSISDEDSFVMAIKHSMENKQVCAYDVIDDFSLHVGALPADADFYGTLDGHGHTITIVHDADHDRGAILAKPIFKTIKKDATVKRLNLIIDEVSVGSNTSENVSALATNNEGTIENCSLNVGDIFIGGNCKNASALVNFNTNQISNIIVTVRAVTYDATMVGWYSRFGAVASVNYAQVKNVFADITFSQNGEGPLKQPLFDYENRNALVGYVFGAMSNSAEQSNLKMGNIYVFCDFYTSRVVDNEIVTPTEYSAITPSFLGEEWICWKLERNGEFPALRIDN